MNLLLQLSRPTPKVPLCNQVKTWPPRYSTWVSREIIDRMPSNWAELNATNKLKHGIELKQENFVDNSNLELINSRFLSKKPYTLDERLDKNV